MLSAAFTEWAQSNPVKVTVAVSVAIASGAATWWSLSRLKAQRCHPSTMSSSQPRAIRMVSTVVPQGFTKEQLAVFNGEQAGGGGPIYIAVKGQVFEVMPQFYGVGENYHVYAGKEISRCLAKSQVSDVEANKDYTVGVTSEELAVLEGWYKKFESKYRVVGWYIPDEAYYQL